MRLRCSTRVTIVFMRHYNISASSSQVHQPLNYINGKRQESATKDPSHKFNLVAPATGETLREVPSAGEKDVNNAVDAAQRAFTSWSQEPAFNRGSILIKAADIIRSRTEELARTEVLDTGKPIWEARYDILGCADTIQYYGGLAASLTGQFTKLANNSFSYTVREPLGVVGGIGAWNYPFQMASWKSSPALACGNTMVFKPSPLTPLTAVMLAEIYKEAGLPDGCFNVVQGEGETGQLMVTHPQIAKMSFTGSVNTGSKIMAGCAQSIKHVTLELGGKSPLIIFADSDLDNAVKGAMMANFLNQGEVCSNGTRVFVQKEILGRFLEKLADKTKRMKIGDPNDEDTMVGATISKEQAEKTLGYVEQAKKEGVNVIYGGDRVEPSDPKLKGGYYLSPCILADCTDEMTVVKEEVFGSVMSVLTFDTEDEAVRRANNTEFGLAGGVFTKDLMRAHRVVSQMEAGSLYVNNYNIYPIGLPFGGYKKSGLGRENGPDTLDYYSQIKSVYFEGGDVDCPY